MGRSGIQAEAASGRGSHLEHARDTCTLAALVLHENPAVSNLIGFTLNHGPFDVLLARDLAEAGQIVVERGPVLAVIDMDHPGSAGFLEQWGRPGNLDAAPVPVIGLTRRGDLSAKLDAFARGVEDILTVPFAPEELLARSVVVVRRVTGYIRPIAPVITLGEISIDIVHREVRAGTSVVHLTGVEQSLLYFLASQPGRVVSRDEIMDAVWGTDFMAESNVVDRHIRALRIKLQNDYHRPRFIATVPTKGYRFIATFSDDPDTGEPSPHPLAPAIFSR
jgi:two-component system alkaline phosphatase synthesis response regulator PhoP